MKESDIINILRMHSFYVYDIEYDYGSWKSYREDIGVSEEDDYPKSEEDFVKMIKELVNEGS